jgi:flagellar biosynthesis protein FliR
MSAALLFCWLMVGLRGLGVIMLFPTLGSQQLPAVVRVALSFAVASLVYTFVPHSEVVPRDLFQLFVRIVAEVVLGLAMGFVGRMTFSTVETAGRLMNEQIGLGGMPGIDTPRASQEPLAALLMMFAALIFFLSNAHYGCLAAFVRSFDLAPAGAAAFGNLSGDAIIKSTGHVIELGFRISAPFIALNFLVNLAFSVLSRAVPKMNVFVISFSLRLILGLALLGSAGMLMARYLWEDFGMLPARMLQLLPLK